MRKKNSKIIRIQVPIVNTRRFIYFCECFFCCCCFKLASEQTKEKNKRTRWNKTKNSSFFQLANTRVQKFRVCVYKFAFKLSFIDVATAGRCRFDWTFKYLQIQNQIKTFKYDYFDQTRQKSLVKFHFVCLCVINIKCLSKIQQNISMCILHELRRINVWLQRPSASHSVQCSKGHSILLMLHFDAQRIPSRTFITSANSCVLRKFIK